MPDVAGVLAQDKRKRAAEEQRQKLREMKMRFVQNKPTYVDDDSDLEIVDNDMHVVAKEEEKERRAMKAKHVRPSVGRSKQLSLAGRSMVESPTKGSPIRRKKEDLEVLQAAAASAFSAEARAERRKGKERAVNKVNPNDLNRLLLRASEKQSREITQQKEKEFYRREAVPQDRMLSRDEISRVKQERLAELIQKGILNAKKGSNEDSDGLQDDDSDGEWTPNIVPENDAYEEALAEDENLQSRESAPAAEDEEYVEQDDENDMPPRPRRRHTMVLDSDSDDENLQPRRTRPDMGRVLVADSSIVLDDEPQFGLNHRGSISSMDERLEDGTDKENDSRLMFDRGEDKENTVIAGSSFALSPTLAGLSRGRGSLLSLDGSTASLPIASQETTGERTPFKELPTEEDDGDIFLSSPVKMPAAGRTTSQQGTPDTPKRLPVDLENSSPLQLRRASSSKSQGLAAFFQPSAPLDKGKGRAQGNDQAGALQPAAVIESGSGGLSQFFEPTLKDSVVAPTARGQGFSQFFTESKVRLIIVYLGSNLLDFLQDPLFRQGLIIHGSVIHELL